MKLALNLVCLALLAACQQQPTPKTDDAPSQGKAAETPVEGATKSAFDTTYAGTMAPDLALETGPDGQTQTLADIRAANPGQKILVNLWATWCAPCIKELPTLDTLAADTKGKLVVVPISQDMEGWQKVTPAFTAEKYPNLHTRLESGMQFGFALKAKGLPLAILYDTDGKEIWRYAGDMDWSSAQARNRIQL